MRLPTLALLLLLLAPGCGEIPAPTETLLDPPFVMSATLAPGRTLRMLDVCDPETFNAVFGPGTCVRNGGLTFQKFIMQLEKHQTVEAWRFMPAVVNVKAGTTLPVLNAGGEVHTYTEVAEFGGGFIPELNQLSGNPVPAPECLDFATMVFVNAGDYTLQTFDSPGALKFMCCIHPWMRAVAHVH